MKKKLIVKCSRTLESFVRDKFFLRKFQKKLIRFAVLLQVIDTFPTVCLLCSMLASKRGVI